MKRAILAILILALFIAKYIHSEPEIDIREPNEKVYGSTIAIEKDQIYSGYLLLINQDYPVQESGIMTDIINLSENAFLTQAYGVLESDIRLSEQVANEFSKMMKAAKKDGIDHFMINSGFRAFDEQNELYLKMGAEYALPAGYSEHNAGLSLDVGSSKMKMEKAPEGKWLEKNAWKYGFILRYPKEKSGITGIQYEPWHFRYVGLPHSAIIHQENFVLEQYLEYLKKKKNLLVRIDGEEYDISYYDLTDQSSIEVQVGSMYEISGDNKNGVIVTSWE
ncbi:D-alanyl-D-alanine carboxypeptidase family protein [Siminovitchia terrae]|uniref:D-alanyl-D-alanine carboxypeptidase family protein n=1 Tax=Siminovitchia terrae TaxID=1914933 RepID=A0A429XDZ4_SIMTE|nr:M15 family metallopeptidase [Siminovitchia terrae]RST61654.1 D-alanyl-D-alanine carboxypeptidase family protein [Siminovitchia terrae]